MATARVYRFERDWKGDRAPDFETGYLGDVTEVIMGALSDNNLAQFPNVSAMQGQVGIPYDQASGILVQPQDFLVLFSVKYLVDGPREWEGDHVFAGGTIGDDVSDYYWVNIKATR